MARDLIEAGVSYFLDRDVRMVREEFDSVPRSEGWRIYDGDNRLTLQYNGSSKVSETGEPEMVLTWISADVKGTGLGSAFMNAAKYFADTTGMPFRILFVTNTAFYERFPWLEKVTRDVVYGNARYIYRPSTPNMRIERSEDVLEEYDLTISPHHPDGKHWIPDDAIILRGGEGSGHFGHAGRPGEVGGSLPSGEKSGRRQVGLTSARPGRPTAQVYQDMEEFAAALAEIQGVENPSVVAGTGGWEGGEEPTWVIEFSGNGQAISLIAETAQRFDQDGVLIMDPCTTGTDCSPVVDFHFSDRISEQSRDEIEQWLVEEGIGGWTWYNNNGSPSLRAVAVPQWGGNSEAHLRAVDRLKYIFASNDLEFDYEVGEVVVSVMNKEGENSYETYIQQ